MTPWNRFSTLVFRCYLIIVGARTKQGRVPPRLLGAGIGCVGLGLFDPASRCEASRLDHERTPPETFPLCSMV
jgi:hypothetical protein